MKLIVRKICAGFFDRDLIAGVLTNIINNLYVYTRDAMEIKVENKDDFLAIHVKDNGGDIQNTCFATWSSSNKKIWILPLQVPD